MMKNTAHPFAAVAAHRTLFPEALRQIELVGALVLEYRTGDGTVVGEVEYGGINGNGWSFAIGWYGERTGNRTTIFRPESWRAEIQDGVLMLHRTAPDTGDVDLPWRTSNLYTIVPRARRERG